MPLPARVSGPARLALVHAGRTRPRRDRIRGWIGETTMRNQRDRKAIFGQPAQ